MDSIVNTYKYIEELGIAVVLAGIFIYIVVRLANIGISYLSTKVKNKKHDKLLDLREGIDTKVYSKISQYLTNHHGTRVQVIEFTNSVMSVAYLPFRYMSCTYEVVSYGFKPEAKIIDKLSTSLFSPFLMKLSKESVIILDDDSADELSGSVHDIFTQIGSKYELCAILRTNKAKNIGFICFCKETEFSSRDKQDIKTLASELSALLGVLDK